MLAKANRITRGTDYRAVVRRGARFPAPDTLTYVRRRQDSDGIRFGFIVSKAVGTAVRRNRVRRRLKSVCRELIPRLAPGTDVVIRALPGSAETGWVTLQEQISRAVDKVGNR